MTIDEIITGVLEREGGYCHNPNDPGGETCYGIDKQTARLCGYMGEMNALPRGTAAAIYRSRFYTGPHFDAVANIAPTVGCALVDIAVNQGVPQASMYLQKALNIFNQNEALWPDVHIDFNVGPSTLDALKSLLAHRGPAGEVVMHKALTCLQGARYIEIGEHNPKLESFEFGWFANRVNW